MMHFNAMKQSQGASVIMVSKPMQREMFKRKLGSIALPIILIIKIASDNLW